MLRRAVMLNARWVPLSAAPRPWDGSRNSRALFVKPPRNDHLSKLPRDYPESQQEALSAVWASPTAPTALEDINGCTVAEENTVEQWLCDVYDIAPQDLEVSGLANPSGHKRDDVRLLEDLEDAATAEHLQSLRADIDAFSESTLKS